MNEQEPIKSENREGVNKEVKRKIIQAKNNSMEKNRFVFKLTPQESSMMKPRANIVGIVELIVYPSKPLSKKN